MTDRNFCHFGPFFSFQPPENQNFKIEKSTWRYYYFAHLYHKWQSYDVWFLRYGAQQTDFFVILGCFLLFYPPMDPENRNFEKMKKIPEDIIILQMCTINDNHMVYGSWDIEHCGYNFLSFWTIFCPCTTNVNHMMYGCWDMDHGGQNFCHFGPFFPLPLLPPPTPNNPKN